MKDIILREPMPPTPKHFPEEETRIMYLKHPQLRHDADKVMKIVGDC